MSKLPTPNDCAFWFLMELRNCRHNMYKYVVLDNLFNLTIDEYIRRKNLNPSELPDNFRDEVRQLLLAAVRNLSLSPVYNL